MFNGNLKRLLSLLYKIYKIRYAFILDIETHTHIEVYIIGMCKYLSLNYST